MKKTKRSNQKQNIAQISEKPVKKKRNRRKKMLTFFDGSTQREKTVEECFPSVLTHTEMYNAEKRTYVVRVSRRAGQTMVLFGGPLKNVALAALTSDSMNVPTVFVGRSAEKDVTALVVPRAGDELKLRLHNLSFAGYINFNLLRKPHQVRTVDPGPEHGLNQVNELKPRSSILVDSDQRTQRSIVIVGTGDSVAMDEHVRGADNHQTGETQSRAAQFYLSVVPATTHSELVNLFSHGTEWRCVDYFVEEERTMIVQLSPNRLFGDHGPMEMRSAFGGVRSLPVHTGPFLQGGDGVHHSGSFGGLPQSHGAAPGVYTVVPRPGAFGASAHPPLTFGSSFGSAPPPAMFAANTSSTMMTGVAGTAVAASSSLLFGAPPASTSAFGPRPYGFTQASHGLSAAPPNPSTLSNGGEAANVAPGGRLVRVATINTGLSYAYDHPSTPHKLRLIIFPHLQFVGETLATTTTANIGLSGELSTTQSNVSVDRKAALEAIESFVGAKQHVRQVFVEDACVICLEQTPDTVYAQCGHCCTHVACEPRMPRTCHMCRERIVARMARSAFD
jgi:hypothetical protein